MTITFSIPRSRPAHLAVLPAPEGCDAPLLQLKGEGGVLIAERDPSLPVYHVLLPALSGGQSVSYEVTALDSADAASGIGYTDADGKVAVSVGGSPFMTFHHTTDYPKPVINPILSPKGTNMLREPMGAWTEGEHPWQRGLTLMQGAINGVDCWNERANKPGFGRTVQDKLTVSHGPLSLVMASDNTWYEGDKPLMTDSRSYRLFDCSLSNPVLRAGINGLTENDDASHPFRSTSGRDEKPPASREVVYSGRDAVVLDVALTLKASLGPVTIGDTKEGGFLCIRVNPTMNASAGGHMGNAYGATDEKGCWSFPSHWMDYYGSVGDETVGFAIFDHPKNFRYPTTWHVRGYGLFAPNCWMFKPDHHLAKGDELTFRWRVTVHSGDTKQADIANRFLDYVDGPRVKWV